MSIESAKAFYQRMIADEAFRTQYQNASSEDSRRDFTLSAGYSFTSEEWETALQQISEQDDGELSEAELTSVSGGLRFIYPWPPEKFPPVQPLYGAPLDLL
ncbi:Nif11-like leader peptide family natural product precursor [Scytonema sp. UIC 10036]|uniref:Nif11-like leader peptide family natural product precursor n=1 Tax=Scytonema sp. UIC 10036 TaxID=2304196 RepID=UPI0012DAF221|nr:Nif11-like leader peptide family natural product precursor [Scytonema sp. UIC 10036]MUG97848.1 Nif11-like leader peptide family natural product precursor [Scytonema sp. UIC 10036]